MGYRSKVDGRKLRGAISLSARVYARLKAYCDGKGISMTQLVEALTADCKATEPDER